MTKRGRRISSVLLGGLAVFLVPTALAWACLPNADIAVKPNQGLARSQVTVTGNDFNDDPVSIRWGSPSGDPLATVTPQGGSFRVKVTIPQAAPDAYFIYAVGSQATRQRPFEVLAPEGSGTTTGGQGPRGGNTGTAKGTTGPAPAAGRQGGSSGSGSARGESNSGSGADSSPGTRTRRHAGRGSGGKGTAVGDRSRSGAGTGSGTAGKSSSGSAPAVFEDSLPARRGQSGSPAKRGQDGTPAVAERNGFGTGKKKSSLTMPDGSDSETAQDAGLGSRLAIGSAMLAIALVALFGAFLVAEVRRRRPLGSDSEPW